MGLKQSPACATMATVLVSRAVWCPCPCPCNAPMVTPRRQASSVSFTSIPPRTASLGTTLLRAPRLQILTDVGHPVVCVHIWEGGSSSNEWACDRDRPNPTSCRLMKCVRTQDGVPVVATVLSVTAGTLSSGVVFDCTTQAMLRHANTMEVGVDHVCV